MVFSKPIARGEWHTTPPPQIPKKVHHPPKFPKMSHLLGSPTPQIKVRFLGKKGHVLGTYFFIRQIIFIVLPPLVITISLRSTGPSH